jgi:hypothetical protein
MTLDKQGNQSDRERELTLLSSVWFEFRGKISKKLGEEAVRSSFSSELTRCGPCGIPMARRENVREREGKNF